MGEVPTPECENGCGRTLGCFTYRQDGEYGQRVELADMEVCCDECDACANNECGLGKSSAAERLNSSLEFDYWDCQQATEEARR